MLPFVWVNLHRCWPHEWKCSIYILLNFAFLVIPASSCNRVLRTLHVNHNLPESLYLKNQATQNSWNEICHFSKSTFFQIMWGFYLQYVNLFHISANKRVFLLAKARTKTELSIYVVRVKVIIYVGLIKEPLKFCDHFKGEKDFQLNTFTYV